MRGCEGRDREEFVALCPRASAMERSFYRWRKNAKSQHDLAEGGINEKRMGLEGKIWTTLTMMPLQ